MRTRIGGVSLAGWIVFVGSASAQEPARSVEVASIRAHSFLSNDYFRGWAAAAADAGGMCAGGRRLTPSGNRLTVPTITLCELVALAYDMAYDISGFRVTGAPAWMMQTEASNYYDVSLKAEGDEPLTIEQTRGLLQALLSDRFQLKIHHGSKAQQVYELTVGKNGAKLKEVPVEDRAQRNGVAMATYLSLMSKYLDRPVVDKTGLTGSHYQYRWEDKELSEQLAQGGKPAPSIFSAVQEQLGLELKAVNEGADVLVIDSVGKPSEN